MNNSVSSEKHASAICVLGPAVHPVKAMEKLLLTQGQAAQASE